MDVPASLLLFAIVCLSVASVAIVARIAQVFLQPAPDHDPDDGGNHRGYW